METLKQLTYQKHDLQTKKCGWYNIGFIF